MPENIVQLEFNLVEFEGIDHIMAEVASRAKENMRTKLVVRIFDNRGMLTGYVQALQEIERRLDFFYEWLPADFPEWPFWKRWPVSWNRGRLLDKKLKGRNELLVLCLEALKETIKREEAIGVEDYPGAPFRLVRHNELHELLERARYAKSVCVFVFKPNELLADRNTIVARAF